MSLRTSTSNGRVNSLSFSYYHPQMSSTSSTSTTTTTSSISPGDKIECQKFPNKNYQKNVNSGTLIYSTSSKSQQNYFPKNDAEKIVEVTNLSTPPAGGLRVFQHYMNTYNEPDQRGIISNISSDKGINKMSKSVSESSGIMIKEDLTKMIDDNNKTKFTKNSSTSLSFHNTLPSINPFKATSARKSKINDNFFIMKERLDEKMNEKKQINEDVPKKNVSFQLTRIPYDMLEECYRHEHKPTEWSVITLNNETKNIPIGIEDSFTPITKANSRKLDAIEIDDIEKDSRIYLDGRFREGDHIKEINGRPVYQMSSQRVKSYFEEMKTMENPSLTLDVKYEDILERTEEIKNKNLKNSFKKDQLTEIVTPIQSKLQQVNSTLIKSNEKDIVLIKANNGFGFNVTSRYNAQNECLLYVSTVKLDSVAYGILEIGDRILKLNNECLSESSQNQFVSQLKAIPVGEKITLCIARSDIDKKEDNNNAKEGNLYGNIIDKKQPTKTMGEGLHKNDISQNSANFINEKIEIKDILIPFNSTPSSGLGISLKARCIHKANGEKQDVGIFVKKALVGGSAYNSGLLKENDRLIGIEGIDLTKYPTNKKAFETIADCLNSLDKNKTHVRLKISRIVSNDKTSDEESLSNVKIDVVRDDQYNDYFYEPNNLVSPALIRAEKNGVTSVTVNDQDSDLPMNTFQNEDDLYFDRQSKTRQSISEKRKNVSNNDPTNLEVFQKIKHLRQTSAPTTTSQSFPKYSPLLNAKKIRNIDSSTNVPINEKSVDINEKILKSINQDSNKNFQSTTPLINQYKPQRSRSSDMTHKKSFFEKNRNAVTMNNFKTPSPKQNTPDKIINIGYSEVPTIEKYERHMYQGPAIQPNMPQTYSFQVPFESRRGSQRVPPPTYSQTLDKKNNYNRYTMIDPSMSYHVMKQPVVAVPHHQNILYHSPIPPPRFGGREGTKHEIQINNDYYDAFNNYFVASETLPLPLNGVKKTIVPKIPERNPPFFEKVISPQTLKKKNLYDGRSHSVFYYDTVAPSEILKSEVTVKRF